MLRSAGNIIVFKVLRDLLEWNVPNTEPMKGGAFTQRTGLESSPRRACDSFDRRFSR